MATVAIVTPTSDGGSVQRHWTLEGAVAEQVYHILRGMHGEPDVEFLLSGAESAHLAQVRDNLEFPPLTRA